MLLHRVIMFRHCCYSAMSYSEHSAVVIDFLYPEFTVNEGEGAVTVTLVKSGLTIMNINVELRLVPGSAGEPMIILWHAVM